MRIAVIQKLKSSGWAVKLYHTDQDFEFAQCEYIRYHSCEADAKLTALLYESGACMYDTNGNLDFRNVFVDQQPG